MKIIIGFFIVLLNISFAFDAKDIQKYNTDVDYFKQMEFAKTLHKGDDYISKAEFNLLADEINKVKNSLGKGPYDFLLYFTSSSVPTKTMMNVLFSLSILQDNGVKLMSKQYLMGPPEDFRGHMFKMNDDLKEFYPSIVHQEKVKRNFHLKIDPRYFDYFKLKEAPAMALARCPGIIPDINKCQFKYFIQGDVSLLTFLDKVSEKNEKFKPLTKILIGNKIITKEDK